MIVRLFLAVLAICLVSDLGRIEAPDLGAAENSGDRPAQSESESAIDTVADFIARRDNRLNHLPAAPIPPDVGPIVKHPIDRFIWSAWTTLTDEPPQPQVCDDATFARRVYLDVIGVIPTVAELNEFLDRALPNKREALVNQLLARDVDYAAHYVSWWEDALASAKSNSFGGVLTRGDYQSWILENLMKNEPFDLMVAELIDPGLAGYKKPVEIENLGIKYRIGFLRDRSHKEILQSAADVAQVFLGTGMKCASCHDHFENPEWPQHRFLGFAGYFSPHDLEVVRCEVSQQNTVRTHWPFEHDLAAIPVPEPYSERLALAARLLTDPLNQRFSETIVNRLWKRFLGTGLYEPVDDYRANASASHPKLLAWLADDLVRHRYDIKHTIRRILTSETYQQVYRAELADSFDLDDRNARRYFCSPGLRRLTAEQLIDSTIVAATQQLKDHRRAFRVYHGVPNDLAQTLGRAATRSEVSTFRSGETAIVQALELINGGTYDRLVHFCVQPPISGKTRLIDIDGSQQAGVRVGVIRVHADGITQAVDLSDVEDLSDVVARVNQFLQQVKIPPHKHVPGQLELSEDSFYLRANPGHSISIEDIDDGQTAADLGIRIQATSSTVTGARLNARAVSSHRQSAPQQTLLSRYHQRVDAAQMAAHIYRLALSRPATDGEVESAAEYLQDNGYSNAGDLDSERTTEPIVDLFWALLTSPMFQYVY